MEPLWYQQHWCAKACSITSNTGSGGRVCGSWYLILVSTIKISFGICSAPTAVSPRCRRKVLGVDAGETFEEVTWNGFQGFPA